jgi:pimeloyl-ACP methyl ester carboxylesterase
MTETPINLRGADGRARRGIVTLPERARSGVGVVLLPAGLKYRVGPHRLNVVLARELAKAGFAVLRVDPLGLGESEGALPAAPLRELWLSIANGRFVADTISACSEFRRRYGLSRVVVGGLCGGAITGLFAAAEAAEEIDGVVSINTAVSLSLDERVAPVLGHLQARHHFKSYLRKLASAEAWRRVLARESDYRAIANTVLTTLRSCLRRRDASPRAVPLPNENPRFIESFDAAAARGVHHLLVFSGNDNRWLEFQEMILQRYLHGQRSGVGYEIRVIPDANHELHWSAWQLAAQQTISEWIVRTFGGEQRTAHVG